MQVSVTVYSADMLQCR